MNTKDGFCLSITWNPLSRSLKQRSMPPSHRIPCDFALQPGQFAVNMVPLRAPTLLLLGASSPSLLLYPYLFNLYILLLFFLFTPTLPSEPAPIYVLSFFPIQSVLKKGPLNGHSFLIFPPIFLRLLLVYSEPLFLLIMLPLCAREVFFKRTFSVRLEIELPLPSADDTKSSISATREMKGSSKNRWSPSL